MNKVLFLIIFILCVSLTTAVYAGSLYGSLGSGRGSLYGSLGSASGLYGSLGSDVSKYCGDGKYRDSKHNKGHKGSDRGHRNYGCGIAAGYIGTPTFIEYITAPVYYEPAPVYYVPVPVYHESPPVADAPTPAPIVETPAPVADVKLDNVPKGHWEVEKIWVPDNKRSWIETYYDESRDVLVLTNRDEKLGANGHWAEREIWVEE
jgi:hypothetical protein